MEEKKLVREFIIIIVLLVISVILSGVALYLAITRDKPKNDNEIPTSITEKIEEKE